jgi:hypothetical protein
MLSVLLLIVPGACGFVAVTKAQGPDHIIGKIQGTVKLKRLGWTKFVPAVVGSLLKNGDTVQLDTPTSRATIFCAGASVREVETSPKTVDCPINQPVVVRFKGSKVTRLRSGSLAPDFPVIVLPRMTKIIADRPLLRWLPVQGVNNYQVTLKRGTDVVWTADVSNATEVVYPATAPALTPGSSYLLIVAAGSQHSGKERMRNLGFSLVSPEEARMIENEAAKIRSLGLPDTTTRLLLANFYSSWGIDPDKPETDQKALNYEAINLLSGPTADQEPAMVRLLGDLYLTIGLNGLAQEQYRKALSLSEQQEDVEGQALAQYALGRIFKLRLNVEEAKRRLHRAKDLFQSYGDAAGIAKVENELTTLPQR